MSEQDTNQPMTKVEQREVHVDYDAEYSRLLLGLRTEVGLFRFLHKAPDDMVVLEVIDDDRHRFEVVSEGKGKITLQERSEGKVQKLLDANLQDENEPVLRASDVETGVLSPVPADAYGVKSAHDLLYEITVLNQR